MRSKRKASKVVASRILKTCINGVSKVRITHQSSPNSIKVISYLLLIDEGLIEVVPENKRIVHKTTPKGIGMIKQFERFHGDIDKLACKT